MTQEVDHIKIYEKLGGMDVKLDLLLERQGDQETRIRTLERHRNWFAGVLASAGVTGTTTVTFWDKIKGVFTGVG